MPDCTTALEGETEEEILEEVETHMREHHGMIELPADMARHVLASVRPEG
jgi:predicted small metal-binding protein